MKEPSPTLVKEGSVLKPARTGFAKMRDGSCGVGSGFHRWLLNRGIPLCHRNSNHIWTRDVCEPVADLANSTSWCGVLVLVFFGCGFSIAGTRTSATRKPMQPLAYEIWHGEVIVNQLLRLKKMPRVAKRDLSGATEWAFNHHKLCAAILERDNLWKWHQCPCCLFWTRKSTLRWLDAAYINKTKLLQFWPN